jgi:hypothetical protein
MRRVRAQCSHGLFSTSLRAKSQPRCGDLSIVVDAASSKSCLLTFAGGVLPQLLLSHCLRACGQRKNRPVEVRQMDANDLVVWVELFGIEAPAQRDIGEVGCRAVELRNSRRAGMRNPVSCTRDFSWRDPSSIMTVSRRSAPLVLIATFDIISFATTIASLEGYRP